MNNKYCPYGLIFLAFLFSACSKDAPEEANAGGVHGNANPGTSSLELGLAVIDCDRIEAHLKVLADVIAFGAEHSSLEQIIGEVVVEEDFALAPDPVPEEVLFIRSDQYSFVKKGVPSVFLVPGFTSTDPEIDGAALFSEHLQTHYHQPSDDLSRPIDWHSALRFARANVRIGHAVAEADERPSWNEGDFFGDKFGR